MLKVGPWCVGHQTTLDLLKYNMLHFWHKEWIREQSTIMLPNTWVLFWYTSSKWWEKVENIDGKLKGRMMLQEKKNNTNTNAHDVINMGIQSQA
jgi:hypothetical protein